MNRAKVDEWRNKNGIAMITKKDLSEAYRKGIVRLGKDYGCVGTVCIIGGNGFYFDGETAESLEPEEYIRRVPKEEIINRIWVALGELKEEFHDEYKYYCFVIKENLS